MITTGLRSASGRLWKPLSRRHFSATPRAAKIITGTQPLRAKEVSGMIGHKYPVVDHEYDALVVGAGGSGAFDTLE